MVGINSTINNNNSKTTTKLTIQTDPNNNNNLQEEFPLSLLDPLSNFDFIDDWLIENDDMSIQENTFSSVNIIGGGELVEEMVSEELGKVSLAGDGESCSLFEVPLVVDSVESVEVVAGELALSEVVKEESVSVGKNDEVKEISSDEVDSVESVEVVVGELALKEESVSVGKNDEDVKEISSDEEDSSSDSESESESESSSSSSSSSEEEEEEEVEEEEKEMAEVIEVEEGEIKYFDEEEILAGSDEDEPALKGPIKSKNEIQVLPPVPPVDATLKPHHETMPVGVIMTMMDTKVVVEGLEKHSPLNEGSILWITETRTPLGLVDEIFGPVKNPFYIVRYNSEQEVPAGLSEGMPVSFVADFADHVLNNKNLYKKGYDASGENDEELGDEVEFSDDEKEAEYRKAQRMASKGSSDRKRGNQEFVARKKVQHKDRSWKNGQPPAQPLGGPSNQTNMANQFCAPPGETPSGSGSRVGSFSIGPASAGVPPSGPPALQVPHANYCTPNLMPANGVWMNGMPGQQQQQIIFHNGFPMNGMAIQQPSHYQQSPQMLNGFPSGMPFQQQFDPNQRMMQNMALPYGQPNFSSGPCASWPGNLGQPGLNQAQFGFGLPGPHPHTSFNAGDSPGFSSGSFEQQSNGMPPPSTMQGNFSTPNQNGPRATSTRGRRPYRRGGHFSGRRGSQ